MKKAKCIYKEFFKDNFLFEKEPDIGQDGRYYTTYKILFPNGEYYIGEHITRNLNDGYAGSGVLLPKKYNQFNICEVKKIYTSFSLNKELMQESEKILIGENYKTDDKCINLIPGGSDGFSTKMVENSSNIRRGKKRTKESIEKQRKTCTGKKHTPAEKEKISNWHKNFFKTEAGDNKRCLLSEIMKNRIRTEEERKKQSETLKQKHLEKFLKNIESLDFESAFSYARNHKNDEIVKDVFLNNNEFVNFFYKKTHKEGPRKKFKMPPRSVEHCMKISDAKKGKSLSETTKKKMSETRRGRNNANYCPKSVGMYDENWNLILVFKDGIDACDHIKNTKNSKATTREIFVACRTGKIRYGHRWKFIF